MENIENIVKQVARVTDAPAQEMANAYSIAAVQNMANDLVRTRRIPYDRKSVFQEYSELIDYIDEQASTAYPGMIVSIVGMNESKKGVYVLMSNGVTLVPTKINGGASSSSSTASTSSNCGTTCCVWVDGNAGGIVVGTDETPSTDTWVAVDGSTLESNQIAALNTMDAVESTIVAGDGTLKVYRDYTPAHSTSAGDWVNGHWSDYTIVDATGAEVTTSDITINEDGKYQFTVGTETTPYISEQTAEELATKVLVWFVKDASNKYLAVREWIND